MLICHLQCICSCQSTSTIALIFQVIYPIMGNAIISVCYVCYSQHHTECIIHVYQGHTHMRPPTSSVCVYRYIYTQLCHKQLGYIQLFTNPQDKPVPGRACSSSAKKDSCSSWSAVLTLYVCLVFVGVPYTYLVACNASPNVQYVHSQPGPTDMRRRVNCEGVSSLTIQQQCVPTCEFL